MSKKGYIVTIVIVTAVGLMIYGSQSSQTQAETFADTEVPCLSGGHQQAINHIHANLTVLVDGQEQSIPARAGINTQCMAEVHTHDQTGEIHIETASTEINRTLEDFFTVWGESFDRENAERTVEVNGETVDGSEYVFSDGDNIVVRYTTEDSEATSTPSESTSTESTSTATSS